MSWPFRKRLSRPSLLPISGPWTIGEGEYNGNVMLVRLNAGYQEFGPVPGYEHQVGIAVPFHAREANGLPSTEESLQLSAIEDDICLVLQEEAASVLVAIITTGGMRNSCSTLARRRTCRSNSSAYAKR